MSMLNDARIFVAGKSGLIGSAVVRLLERESCRHIIAPSRDELDLQDAVAVTRFFNQAKPQYVILAAGRVGGIVENQIFPADFMDVNIAIQLNVLKAARKSDVTKLILFGSSCMYPRECPQPMAEDVLLSASPEPTSLPYAISKLAGTYMCLAYNKQDGDKRFIPVIPNSAYGPNDNFDPKSGHVLSALLARFHAAKVDGIDSVALWGSGSPRREFVHADDIAAACWHLLKHDVSSLEFPLNIGLGSDISIRQLAETIASVVGYRGQLVWDTSKPDGAPRKLLDSSRLNTFGWKAGVQLEDGLRGTYEWYRQNCVEPTVQTV